jgi:hypothetical protein
MGAGPLLGVQPTIARARSGPEAFEAMLTEDAAPAGRVAEREGEGRNPDFTSMTRQELFDWMNAQLRDGKMSLQESAPFLAMTVKYSAAAGKMVDMATDATRVDFTERARQGAAFCRSHFDYEGAERLERALAIMQGA